MKTTFPVFVGRRVGNRIMFETEGQSETSSPDSGFTIANPSRLISSVQTDEETSSIIRVIPSSEPEEKEASQKVVVSSKEVKNQSTSRVLNLWEGYVLKVGESDFLARLIDIKRKEQDHEAEFDIATVSECDRELLEEGAVFYWSICYQKSITGQITSTSDIRFRRRTNWSAAELQEAKQASAEIAKLLNLESI